MQTEIIKKKIKACTIGMRRGIAQSISSVIVFLKALAVGKISHIAYGGDAYTGIQNAAADTGNHVYGVGLGVGAILLFGGLAIYAYFYLKSLDYQSEIEVDGVNSISNENDTKISVQTEEDENNVKIENGEELDIQK